jgi:flavin reductase (DIM6/NTAB) family NADH-FMN oxidoreductase RutF
MSDDARAYKEALSRFASGVTVVTTQHEGALHGLTVSAFASVSAVPPRIVISLGNTTESKPLIERSGVFAVHILGRDHVGLGPRFAKLVPGVSDPFDGLPHRVERTGAPILSECLAWLDCRVETMLPVGDHTLFIGAVEALGYTPGVPEPVLYYQRGWRVLDPNRIEP